MLTPMPDTIQNYFESLENRIASLESQIQVLQHQPTKKIPVRFGVEELREHYLPDTPAGTIRQWIFYGLIPNEKIGRRVYFNKEEIEAWLKARKRKPIAERVESMRQRN
jgi:excisionase family DNA binding protein